MSLADIVDMALFTLFLVHAIIATVSYWADIDWHFPAFWAIVTLLVYGL
jgi:hypothetical protein